MAELRVQASRLMLTQAAVTLVFSSVLVGYAIFFGPPGADRTAPAVAALYGGLIGIVSTWISRRSVERATKAAKESTSLAMVPVYVGLVNKFLMVGGGLAIGLIALELSPLSVVAGYIVSQLALVGFMFRPV